MAQSQIITAWGAGFLKGNWRYVRNTFGGMGQDSFTQPPSQNEDQLQSTLNVLPPLDGGFRPRWGYNQFATGLASNSTSQSTPLFLYQADTANFRNYVIPQTGGIPVYTEAGAQRIASLFTPQALPRMVSSRSYGYFASGNPLDLRKWDGTTATGNVTNWGIQAPTAPPSAMEMAGAGANGSLGSYVQWMSPNNVTSPTLYALADMGPISNPAYSNWLQATAFGFALAADVLVSGVTVTLDYTISTDQPVTITAQLLKAGVLSGTPLTVVTLPAGATIVNGATVGGINNLWGTSLSPADVNDTNFGVAFQAALTNGDQTSPVQIRNVKMQIGERANLAFTTGSGAVTLVSGRIYYAIYLNANTGQYSDLSTPSDSTGPLTAQEIDLTGIPTSPDPQVTNVILLATPDGGDEEQLYYVATLPNGTTTYTDDTPETILVLNDVYLGLDSNGDEIGVSFNDPPPSDLQFPIKHRGRLYGVSQKKNLFFSKAESELLTSTGLIVGKFEECWPPTNYFDVSEGAEEILGLLSDGQVLYIGTEKRIIRLFGDGPSTYLIPEALFQDVGIQNQDCWQMIFLEGNPVGAMWLTHDYRVVGSDFNTYQDVGTPIQDILNSINRSASQQASWASYAALGQFNFYILAVPTGSATQPNTLLVFDLKQRQWYVWQTTSTPLGQTFNVALSVNEVQNVFVDSTGSLQLWDNELFQDNGVSFPLRVQTSWSAMGDPAARKYLNEIEVTTGDLSTLVTVEGASTTQDYAAPRTVVASAGLVQKPLGPYFVSLAAYPTKDRYYRLTFASTSSGLNWLRGYNVEGTVLDRL